MNRFGLMTFRVLYAFAFAAAFAVPATALAEEPTADQIAAKIVRGNGLTWEGAHTRLRMILIDSKGEKSERALDVLGRKNKGRLESVVRFDAPAKVAGTKFLMLDNPDGASEQYIYLPGLKRTRRIVGREREGSFMGSDFTYQDLSPKADPGGKHKRLPDEKIGKDDVYVLETTTGNVKATGYSKLVTWVRKSDSIPLRTKFFDESGKHKKTLYVRRTREVSGKPVVVEARMQAENGHATELIVDSLEENAKLPDAEFTPAALTR
jgi:hypothetical protein